jgi:hypothetical protein
MSTRARVANLGTTAGFLLTLDPAPAENCRNGVVSIRETGGLDDKRVADYALHRKTSAFDLRRHRFDLGAQPTFRR